MARPKKENADYYSHDGDMRNDPKIKALRRQFGHEGYAVYNMLLEVLTRSAHFTIEPTPITLELLAGDFDTTSETLTAIIDYGVKVQLFCREGNQLFSAGLKKRLAQVVEKRQESRKRFLGQERGDDGSFCSRNYRDGGVSATETPQRKRKERKLKSSNDDNSAQGTLPPVPPKAEPGPGPQAQTGPAVRPIDELADECLPDQNLQREAANRCGIPPQQLPEFVARWPDRVRAFVLHIRSDQKPEHQTPQDFRSHLKNWLNKRLKAEREDARQFQSTNPGGIKRKVF